MKAAILFAPGETPQCVDVPEPVPQNDREILVSVKAVALKHLDKSRAKGTHYSTEGDSPEARVIGGDGVCLLPDGTRVYAISASGMAAEKATIEKNTIVRLPPGLDDCTAAALPNAVFGSAMAIRFRAGMEAGDTVLVNGATGFTGRLAVQLARYYGAGKIIATGRNARSLDELMTLGADQVISLHQTDSEIVDQLTRIHRATPINVVIDYLWGHTAELILTSIKGKGPVTPRTRFVSVGAMTGEVIQLSSAILRSIDLQLSGSGLGSWTQRQIEILFSEILPEMFGLAAGGKLKIETVPIALKDIEKVWELDVSDGKRLVIRTGQGS
jgi:NADPH:quinone reductase-like Zn-dependent oxidoreductase